MTTRADDYLVCFPSFYHVVPPDCNFNEGSTHVGLIHHWGFANTFTSGDLTNDLTPNVGDPNSFIPEYKAFLVDVRKA